LKSFAGNEKGKTNKKKKLENRSVKQSSKKGFPKIEVKESKKDLLYPGLSKKGLTGMPDAHIFTCKLPIVE